MVILNCDYVTSKWDSHAISGILPGQKMVVLNCDYITSKCDSHAISGILPG